jgi:hypothetical protein
MLGRFGVGRLGLLGRLFRRFDGFVVEIFVVALLCHGPTSAADSNVEMTNARQTREFLPFILTNDFNNSKGNMRLQPANPAFWSENTQFA